LLDSNSTLAATSPPGKIIVAIPVPGASDVATTDDDVADSTFIRLGCVANEPRLVLRKILTPKAPYTTDIRGKLILLGTGTSVGVPAIGCSCAVCTGGHPRNQRTRSSAIFGLPGGNLLIDASPDLRQQLLRERIGIVHAVAFTHEHADHIFGLDDLRLFQFYLGHAVPLYCEAHVEERLRKSFDYAFNDEPQTHLGSVPALTFHTIDRDPFAVLGAEMTPIPLDHGPRFSVLGFRIGNVAYCTDVKSIPRTSWPLLEGLDTLVLSALRPDPHPTHMNLDEAIAAAKKIGARQTYFTHCSCRIDHPMVDAQLPPDIRLGYDGLAIELT
jgi:phosphoribosyl 1,2-cyclic phosphate phosphodiesterase